MSDIAYDLNGEGQPDYTAERPSTDDIRPVPRISVQVFCDSPEMLDTSQEAGRDRRMAKAHLKAHAGGLPAAVEFYGSAPTPNVLLLETRARPEDLIHNLDSLAEVCDPGTRVLIVADRNDVNLYRELMRRGVSEYVVGPIDHMQFVQLISDLYHEEESDPLGRVFAFIGAKGGVGASTIAHNVAWSLSSRFQTDTVMADLDLPFGTANLDYNQDPPQGIGDAVFSPERIDDVFLDRILSKCADHLSLLAAPATLEKDYDFSENAFETIIDLLRSDVPSTVLDIPHTWNGWTRQTLSQADEIVVVCAPDLANLRNAKNIVDHLRQDRPNDKPPYVVLNQMEMPKRPEIAAKDFTDALEIEPLATIQFDPQLFGVAANNGQMIAEASARSPVVENFDLIAQVLTGRAEIRKQKRSPLAPLLAKLGKKKSD